MPHSNLPITISRGDYGTLAAEIVENNIVAIVQPIPAVNGKAAPKKISQNSFKTGCAGKITDINFTEEDVNINIYGLCRFDIVSDVESAETTIERVVVCYDRYLIDMSEQPQKNIAFEAQNSEKLIHALDVYFKNLEIFPNWKEIQRTPIDVLVSALAMACPLHPSERQSILEAVDIQERSDIMRKIIEMNSFNQYNTARTVN